MLKGPIKYYIIHMQWVKIFKSSIQKPMWTVKINYLIYTKSITHSMFASFTCEGIYWHWGIVVCQSLNFGITSCKLGEYLKLGTVS